ncbi:MAG: hypothetical protein IJX51_06985 [Clostridia bacterium]|nr:hypothetical protein [Clostridia bacterium]
MEIYRIHYQINEEAKVSNPTEFDSFLTAESIMRNMIAKQGRQMNVASYISAIRKGNNPEYRSLIADVLENLFSESEPMSPERIKQMKETIEDFNLDCRWGDREPVDNFRAKIDGRAVIFDFLFDQHLHFEFDVKSDATDGTVIYSYLFIKDRKCKLLVSVDIDIKEDNMPQNRSNSASILLVYRTLINDALEVKEAIEKHHMIPGNVLRGITPKKISEACEGLSVETVVKHIKTLKMLGIPIKLYKASKYDKEIAKQLLIRCDEGYEIDIDFFDKVPKPIDASAFGIHVNPILVLFVLKTSNKPMRQDDIIKRIKEEYKVSIARAAVGRHINMLKIIGHSIKKSKDGYILEK